MCLFDKKQCTMSFFLKLATVSDAFDEATNLFFFSVVRSFFLSLWFFAPLFSFFPCLNSTLDFVRSLAIYIYGFHALFITEQRSFACVWVRVCVCIWIIKLGLCVYVLFLFHTSIYAIFYRLLHVHFVCRLYTVCCLLVYFEKKKLRRIFSLGFNKLTRNYFFIAMYTNKKRK